jgi:HD-GYP domain-containing protein (c-di-GMP phosphodiesterase class II)
MSSDHPIDDPSAPADPPLTDPDLPRLIRELGEPLLEGLEESSPGATEHADAAGAYAFATAVGLGFKRGEADLCREAARLTDVGRIYQPGGAHHEAGAQLARGAGLPEVVCEWILGVAEHYDGTGPAALSGSEIPVFSRIIRAAKRCDEFVSQGLALSELRSLAGTELDPAMVDALASMLERAE